MEDYRGRFAPSATGPLHLGSIFAALISYVHARQHNGQWLIRIDDLDTARCRAEYTQSIISCLNGFGLQASEPIQFQSDRLENYEEGFHKLLDQGLLYTCDCTRKALPRGPYPGACRHRIGTPLDNHLAVRIDSSEIDLKINDLIVGHRRIEPPGDFIVKRRDGLFAYQLACAIDEQLDRITHVIRGIDLLPSTPMQRLITTKLNHESPHYGHFPVLVGGDGVKLSKQTFAPAVDWEHPGVTYASIARRLLLNDTPSEADNVNVWLNYFMSLDGFPEKIQQVT